MQLQKGQLVGLQGLDYNNGIYSGKNKKLYCFIRLVMSVFIFAIKKFKWDGFGNLSRLNEFK